MQVRTFGRFGYKASQLGFGAMRLPTKEDGSVDFDRAVPLIRRAVEQSAHGIAVADVAKHFWSYQVLEHIRIRNEPLAHKSHALGLVEHLVERLGREGQVRVYVDRAAVYLRRPQQSQLDL